MKVAFAVATLSVLTASDIFPATPDEIALKMRASQFYALQVEGKRAQAAELVEPKTRDLFLNGRRIPYISHKIDRVLVTGPETAEVEVTVELALEMFPRPVPRSFPTNWKKVSGKWYFVVDTAVNDAIRSKMPALPLQPKTVLSYKPVLVFGQDSEIQKSVRVVNNSTEVVEFRIVGYDDLWLDIKNRSGEIPPGEYFPLVITLKQVPERNGKQAITIEGVTPDKRIHMLEIPVTLEAPAPACLKPLRDAIRKYRKDN